MTAMMAFWVAVVSLVFGAVCSTLHLSLRGLSRSRIDQLAERGSDGLRVRATKILVDRTGHAASIALPRVLANILAALAMLIWVNKVRGHPPEVGFTASDILITTVVATPVMWLFGYVLPLSISTHAGERTVLVFSPLIRWAHLALAPAGHVERVTGALPGRGLAAAHRHHRNGWNRRGQPSQAATRRITRPQGARRAGPGRATGAWRRRP